VVRKKISLAGILEYNTFFLENCNGDFHLVCCIKV
jgi:hypothetical protein